MNIFVILLSALCLMVLVLILTQNDKNSNTMVRDENMACEENDVTCRKKDGQGYMCCPREAPVCCSEEGCCPKNHTCCGNGKACCPPEAPICCFGYEDDQSEEATWLCVDSQETCRDKKIKR